MSPDEGLANRSSFELSQIERELKVISRLLGRAKELGPDEIKVRAAAGSLHSIYNGIEKLIQYALEAGGVPIPGGSDSHSELLALAKARGLISDPLEQELRAYMGFRHFYRHSYGFMIDHELLNPLLQKARDVVSQLASELRILHSGA